MEAILAVPDFSLWTGQRDHALLLTMYNGGGRVSEITGLSWQQVRFGTTTYLDLNGKGRKERRVPLWPKTAKVLHQWRRRQAESSCKSFRQPTSSLRRSSSGTSYLPIPTKFLSLRSS
jgi:integrase/recombinase XerD